MFKGERFYPVAFASFLMHLFWHPIGDYFESLTLGWSIVPNRLLTVTTIDYNFIVWYLQTYGLSWIIGFIPLTLIGLAHKYRPSYVLLALPALGAFYYYYAVQIPLQTAYEPFRIHKMLDQLYPHCIYWIAWLTIPSAIGYYLDEIKMLGVSALTAALFIIIHSYAPAAMSQLFALILPLLKNRDALKHSCG